jgi:thymidylate synthase (FAD)
MENLMFDFNKAQIYLAPDDIVGRIEYLARVSNPAGQDAPKLEKGKLLDSLIKRKHWSPLEMLNVVMYVETTRDIGRQLLRHGFRFQEFSQRYQVVNTDAFVTRKARRQDLIDRQNSIDDMSDADSLWWENSQKVLAQSAAVLYEKALSKGIAKEQARAVLPEGMTLSRMYVNGNVRTWYHYCQLRGANGTQLEHMDLAEKCRKELVKVAPTLFENMIMEDH